MQHSAFGRFAAPKVAGQPLDQRHLCPGGYPNVTVHQHHGRCWVVAGGAARKSPPDTRRVESSNFPGPPICNHSHRGLGLSRVSACSRCRTSGQTSANGSIVDSRAVLAWRFPRRRQAIVVAVASCGLRCHFRHPCRSGERFAPTEQTPQFLYLTILDSIATSCVERSCDCAKATPTWEF